MRWGLCPLWLRGLGSGDSRSPLMAEGSMKRTLAWLGDAEWALIEPFLPRGRKGALRVDTGAPSRASCTCSRAVRAGATARPNTVPPPRSTTAGAGRASGWACSRRRLDTAACGERLRSTPPTSRRTARQAAQKGGLRASHRRLVRRPDQQAPRTDRSARPAAPAHAFGRRHQRHDYGTQPARAGWMPLRQAHRRQGVMSPMPFEAPLWNRRRRAPVP